MLHRDAALAALLAVTLAGASCTNESDQVSGAGPDGGLPDAATDAGPCGPGEARDDAGACRRAGVPPELCAAGFVPDDMGGCSPILPAKPCPSGMLAVPGDEDCRPVAPCGEGDWGDIPVEPSTEYVKAGYDGGDSDGSAERPWTTIQKAIAAAEPGAIVAVAAGTYAEELMLLDKRIRLWGRCPELVEVSGSSYEAICLDVDQAEVHGVALRSEVMGVLVSDAKDVLLDRVWFHDTADIGLFVLSLDRTTSARLSGSLVERASGMGIFVAGSKLRIDGSVVRDTGPHEVDGPGRGINLEPDMDYYRRPALELEGSVIERNREAGIGAFGADVTIRASVIRDTQPRQADGRLGMGLAAQADHGAAKVAVEASAITGSRTIGLTAIDSELSVRTTVVSGTLGQQSDGLYGDGLSVVRYEQPALLRIEQSLVAQAARAGITNFSAEARIAGTAFLCNPIDLDGEVLDAAFSFADEGGNACSCGAEARPCVARCAGLQPPAPLP
ncbi:MAG: DUF1565 domain-containing protein [Deltaproteobacteria bacterium]|nr:DUF1565 domain-containing protein [Deltaproteobacteria bacterium]